MTNKDRKDDGGARRTDVADIAKPEARGPGERPRVKAGDVVLPRSDEGLDLDPRAARSTPARPRTPRSSGSSSPSSARTRTARG